MSEIVVFLGNLKTAPHEVHNSRAESLGFTVKTEITENTKYVVCGENVGPGVDEARNLGLTILEEEEWEDILVEREKEITKISQGTSEKRTIEEDESENDLQDTFAKPTTYMVAGNRYWEIRLDGRKTHIRTGKVGERGLTSMKEHKNWADAKKSMTDLVEKKKSQGFQKQRKPKSDITGSKTAKKRKQKLDDSDGTSNTASPVDDGNEMMDLSPDENVTSDREKVRRDDKNHGEGSSTISPKYNFKKPSGLPSSIVKSKPISIMKGRVPELLLAHSWKEDEVDPVGWWMSEKLDGVRAFWCGKQGKFFSRQGNCYVAPEWFTKGFPRDVDLDGELFGGRGKFQSTVSIVKAGEDEWKSITYEIFDVPSYMNAPFEDRMSFIEDMFEKQKPAYGRIVQHRRCKSAKDVWDELKRVESLGGEGLMIRKPKSEYVCSRSNVLLKVKSFFDGEALVEGYEPGKGKYHNMTGALKCVMACGKKFKVGSGMTDEDRRKPPKIGSIIVYRCQELSDSGNPRFPTFVGIAADKDKPKDPDFGHKLKV
ncbi:7678_t:CDS:2, partial [Acaulospora morrowiae]